MNRAGYFDRLVDRALGRAPVLTPRRGARFEPVAPSPVQSLEETLELASSPRVNSPAVPGAPAASPRYFVATPPVSQPAVKPAAALPLIREVREHRTTELHHSTIWKSVDAPAPIESKPTAIAPAPSLPPLPEVRAARVAEPAVPPREFREAPEPPSPFPAFMRVQDLELDDHSSERPAPNSPPPPPAAQEKPQPPVIAYDVRPAAPPSLAAVPKLEAEPAAETTVHITIGRVDVQAHVNSSSAPTRTRAPRLGLDEYLRRREGA